jgi:hypothetical protein
MQVGKRLQLQLAAENEPLQLCRQCRCIDIRQDQPQGLGIDPQQREQRNHAAFRGQPAVPVPLAIAQCGDVIHELRLREGHRIAPGDGQDIVARQFEILCRCGLRVVGHGGGT